LDRQIFTSEVFLLSSAQKPSHTRFLSIFIHIYIFFHASHFKLKIRKKHYGSHAHSGSEEKILITAFCEVGAAAGG